MTRLCDTCKRATAVDCPWLGEDDATGIAFGERRVVQRLGGLKYEYVQRLVVACKRYQKGELPPIDAASIATRIYKREAWKKCAYR